jgi:hypothetical protein
VIRYAALFATALIAGCAGSTGSQSSLTPTAAQSVVLPIQNIVRAQSHVVPETCDAAKVVKLEHDGGTFKMPPCSGWTGTISYPELSEPGAHFKLKVTSSVTNNFGAPNPPSGTATLYLQTANDTRGGVPSFGPGPSAVTLTSPELTSRHTYTVIVYNFLECQSPNGGSCPPWVDNVGSPAPGSHSLTFTSAFDEAVFNGGGFSPPVWQFIQD